MVKIQSNVHFILYAPNPGSHETIALSAPVAERHVTGCSLVKDSLLHGHNLNRDYVNEDAK
jgi:hypothetical protein